MREDIGPMFPDSMNAGMRCPAKHVCQSVRDGGTVSVIDFERLEGQCRSGHLWSFSVARN
jgi:hypothetical protein